MKNKIKALIFDVGGVLFLAKKNKNQEGKDLLSSFKEVCVLLKDCVDIDKSYENLRKIYLESSAGKISKKETLKLFSKEIGIPEDKTEKIFGEVYRKNVVENKKLYSYILKLKKRGYKIGISSIQFHLSKEILIPNKYYEKFDSVEVSCDNGLRKPDPEAFKLSAKHLNTNLSECIFVDDKQENLDAARELGMKTILFKNNPQFFRDLKKFGIK